MVARRENLWRCCLCHRVMLRKNLYVHLRVIHKLSEEEIDKAKTDIAREAELADGYFEIARMCCPACEKEVLDHVSLAKHCEELHRNDGTDDIPQDYRIFTLSFDTCAEFEKWLAEECERTSTSFTRRTSSDGGASFHLRCHIAGTCVNKLDGSVSTHQNKKKTNNCSCFLNVRLGGTGRVTVQGCFGHIGHKTDTALLRLSDTQELLLKRLLEEYPMDDILTRLKQEYSEKNSRLGLITRKDLWNIAKRYQLVPIPAHKRDGVESPILYVDDDEFPAIQDEERLVVQAQLPPHHDVQEGSSNYTKENVADEFYCSEADPMLLASPASNSENDIDVCSLSESEHNYEMRSLSSNSQVAESLERSEESELISTEGDCHTGDESLPSTSNHSPVLPEREEQLDAANVVYYDCYIVQNNMSDDTTDKQGEVHYLLDRPVVLDSATLLSWNEQSKQSTSSENRMEKVSPRENLWQCSICEKMMLRRNLYMHLKTIHKYTKEEVEQVKFDVAQQAVSSMDYSESARVFCPVCEERVLNHASLAMHCDKFHRNDGGCGEAQDYRVFTAEFNTNDEFEKWLSDECERTSTSFSRRSSSDGGTSFALRCHRAGKYVCKASRKLCNSKKQARNCSCFLNVRISDTGAVTVQGCFGHVGHKIEVDLLRLSQSQELFLKGLLQEYPMNDILKRLKREYSAKDSRLAHVTRTDLWNVVKKYHILRIPPKGSKWQKLHSNSLQRYTRKRSG